MDCSCHEPAVFGHLECELAPRGHMTEHAAAAQRAEVRQRELARRMEKAAEVRCSRRGAAGGTGFERNMDKGALSWEDY